MSHAATNPAAVAVADSGHHHDPHLAHHFDTPEQQYQSGKLGMWVFLATEILMFGGLFCAYSVYRHNHPEVFAFAHKALDPILGGINTLVLIASSFTMAWGVRAAQLNQKKVLVFCLALTILGGAGFMGIKSIEYETKWKHNLFPGTMNVYSEGYKGEEKVPNDLVALMNHGEGGEHAAAPVGHMAPAHVKSQTAADFSARMAVVDPNAGTPDEAKIKPNFATTPGLAAKTEAVGHEHLLYSDLNRIDRNRVAVFFSVYFLMTGLHGIHVMVGMGLIFWILRRSLAPGARMFANALGILVVGLFFVFLGYLVAVSWVLWAGVGIAVLGVLGSIAFFGRARRATGEGEFSSRYFAPVDLVGLYWHLVDLIWIFLFPLLYLIH